MRVGDLRIRGLLLTIFADLILPRGGELGIAELQKIVVAIGLEPGAVRTATSRLVADGRLRRRREGRHSIYRMSERQLTRVTELVPRVYAASGPGESANWLMVWLEEDHCAQALREAGFLCPAPQLFLWPLSKGAPPDILPSDAILCRGPLTLPARRRAALCRPEVLDAIRALGADLQAVAALDDISEEVAIGIRVLMIHRWRNLILDHPDLPPEVQPSDWPVEEVRGAVASCYRKLMQPSEHWLRRNIPQFAETPWNDLPTRF
ncbi:PaaX family transcriptional regulator C-terminal domain-containing protein [Roseobacter sp. HKCCA0434]|uniref:PaaX family transcriptional regulator C-terminal domain-containing protein n=1 Tax=Roseobacter sp. HKCCA0434 TaxID=3079297 RepID=UPI002905ED07|nr:PaaX family transcriptional regulator C-terminal domain-containing protein [Roseobacter sp. HKCCA0434]